MTKTLKNHINCSEINVKCDSLSPVARDHWGIFELIIKESGDEGSDGKGRKSEVTFPSLSFSFPSLPACALRSFPASLSRASRISCVLASPPIPS